MPGTSGGRGAWLGRGVALNCFGALACRTDLYLENFCGGDCCVYSCASDMVQESVTEGVRSLRHRDKMEERIMRMFGWESRVVDLGHQPG